MTLFLLVCCLSCKKVEEDPAEKQEMSAGMKFDKSNWQITDGSDYIYREPILQDLVKTLLATKKARPLKRDEILHMLGNPQG